MNRLEINLASSPFRNNIMYYLFHGLLITFIVCATSFNIYFFVHYQTLRGKMRQVLSTSQQEMEDLDKKAQKMRTIISKKNLKEISQRSVFANDIILMRKFFWTELFNKLEEVLPYSVKMQSIRPIFQETGIEVRVDGLAQNLKSFFEFEKNLQNNPSFANIRPENYRQLEGADLVFSLVFEYRQEGTDIEAIYNEKAVFSREALRTVKGAPAAVEEGQPFEERGAQPVGTESGKGE